MMKAMLLAAGKGERMQPLTHTIPKPLLKVGHYSLIEHQILALARAGIRDIVINIAREPQQYFAILGDGKRYNVDLAFSYEEQGPLGTGGGILQALPLLGEAPFLVVSSDIWTDFCYTSLLSQVVEDAHLILVPNPNYHLQGDFCLQDNGQVSMQGNKLTYANIGIIHPRIFAQQQSGTFFSLAPLLMQAITQGKVSGELYLGQWYNVGTPQQLQALRSSLSSTFTTDDKRDDQVLQR